MVAQKKGWSLLASIAIFKKVPYSIHASDNYLSAEYNKRNIIEIR